MKRGIWKPIWGYTLVKSHISANLTTVRRALQHRATWMITALRCTRKSTVRCSLSSKRSPPSRCSNTQSNNPSSPKPKSCPLSLQAMVAPKFSKSALTTWKLIFPQRINTKPTNSTIKTHNSIRCSSRDPLIIKGLRPRPPRASSKIWMSLSTHSPASLIKISSLISK